MYALFMVEHAGHLQFSERAFESNLNSSSRSFMVRGDLDGFNNASDVKGSFDSSDL